MSGELPEGWRRVSVADLGVEEEQTVLTGPFGTNMSRDDFVQTGVPVLTIGCLTDKGISLEKAMFVSEAKAAELARYRLREGDLLFSRMASVGRAAEVPPELNGALFNYHLMRLRLDDSKVLTGLFLGYVKGAPAVKTYLEEVNHGATRDGINTSQLLAMPVALPAVYEQRRIVAKLEALQARSRRAKEALDTVPALLEKLRQSILAAAFRGDLTKDWRAQNPNVEPASELLKRIRAERRAKWEETELAKLKAKGKTPSDDKWKAKYKEPEPVDTTGLPELPLGWCWAALEDVLISLDQGWSPQCEASPRTSSDEWAVMRTTAVQQLRFDENENKRLPAGLEPRPGAELAVGDLLITRAGPRVRAGVCCRVDAVGPRLMACDKVYRVRMNERFALGAFVELVLNSPTALEAIERMKTGISESGVNLTREKFLALSVPVPPLREQSRIVDAARQAVRDCHRFALAEHDLVDSLATLDSALLAKAFRGELVPQDPNDEPAGVMLDRPRAENAVDRTSAPRRGRKAKG